LACITKGTTEQTSTTLYRATGRYFGTFTSSTLEITEDFFTATGTITFTRHFTTAIYSFFETRGLRCIGATWSFTREHRSLTNLRKQSLLLDERGRFQQHRWDHLDQELLLPLHEYDDCDLLQRSCQGAHHGDELGDHLQPWNDQPTCLLVVDSAFQRPFSFMR
jgi:hypothetical protein